MSREERWLDETVRVVAREAPPDIDWARVEQGVFQYVEEHAPRRVALVLEVPWRRLLAIAAVAAASVVGLTHVSGSRSSSTQPSPSAPDQLATAPRSGPPAPTASLYAGLRIHAVRPTSYSYGGWASFVAQPSSDITVDRLGNSVQLSLASGSVEVAVTPGQPPGSFIVVAGGTAVAVHGTRFTVTRRSADIVVQVSEGVVSVGAPTRRGANVRWLVAARSQGTFSLDGANQARFSTFTPPARTPLASADRIATSNGPAPDAGDTPADAPAPEVRSVPGAPSPAGSPPAAEPALPDSLTLASANTALAPLLSSIHACYRQAASSQTPGVTVTVTTTLSLKIAPNGSVAEHRFDPPLKPDALACAIGALQAASFPKARHESRLRVDLQF